MLKVELESLLKSKNQMLEEKRAYAKDLSAKLKTANEKLDIQFERIMKLKLDYENLEKLYKPLQRDDALIQKFKVVVETVSAIRYPQLELNPELDYNGVPVRTVGEITQPSSVDSRTLEYIYGILNS